MTPAERFGEQLRRDRERAGISLAAIAERTNVIASHFAALERGDCSNWPPGVYSRAFLRGYARAIGLHPEQVLAEAAQYFTNFNDEGLPLSMRCPEAKLELRMQLDAPNPDYQRIIRTGIVFAVDAAIALAAGLAVSLVGGRFWMTVALVWAFCHAVSLFRSSGIPRSAFLLPKIASRPAPVPHTETDEEPFGEEVLDAESV